MNCLDGLKLLKDESINCCVTSPPYYALRDYGINQTVWTEIKYFPMTGIPYEIEVPAWKGCLGLEPTIEMFIAHIVLIFRQVKRVLKNDGTLWLNFGDSFVGTGGNRKHEVKNPIFQEQQSHNPSDGRYERNKLAKDTGLKVKDLMGIPWRVAFALQADGWYLRMDNIWNKPSCMPEAVKDRTTKSHEYMFLLSKSKNYYYDYEAIKEPCVNGDPNPPRGSKGVIGNLNLGRRLKGNAKSFRGGGAYTQGQTFNNSAVVERETHGNKPNKLELRNKRSVWTVATDKFSEAHFATFPPKLIEPCILAGCPVDGIVLDPFMGSGTTAAKSLELQRNYIGFEINQDYIKMSQECRLNEVQIKIV
jgi:DNA modification methylase